MDTFTNGGLRDKIEWEGGIDAALEYGIRVEEIQDPNTAEIWKNLVALHKQMAPLIDSLYDIIEDADD